MRARPSTIEIGQISTGKEGLDVNSKPPVEGEGGPIPHKVGGADLHFVWIAPSPPHKLVGREMNEAGGGVVDVGIAVQRSRPPWEAA